MDEDHFYSKAAFTLCFFLHFTRRGSLRCCKKAVVFGLYKRTAGKMSRQMAETAVSCRGRPRVPKAPGSSKQKGAPQRPRPGSRGVGVWNTDDGFCTRQLWTPDARRTRRGDTAEGLSSQHSRAGSRPAPPAEAVSQQDSAQGIQPLRAFVLHLGFFSFLDFGAWQQRGVFSRWLLKGTGKPACRVLQAAGNTSFTCCPHFSCLSSTGHLH